MHKVVVIYDSQTGFTEKMAEAVAKGARGVEGVEVELLKLGTPFSTSRLTSVDAIAFGSPVVYGSVTKGMRLFLQSIKEQPRLDLSGKIGGAFGSYAFSGGWVINEFSEDMVTMGLRIVAPPVAAVDGIGRRQPLRLDKETFQRCTNLGRTLATSIGDT